jgi:hypothetical protein
VEISAAHAGAVYLDQNVVDADFRHFDIFEPQARLALAFNESFHSEGELTESLN